MLDAPVGHLIAAVAESSNTGYSTMTVEDHDGELAAIVTVVVGPHAKAFDEAIDKVKDEILGDAETDTITKDYGPEGYRG